MSKCKKLSVNTLAGASSEQKLAAHILRFAVWDAMDLTDVPRAAEARFWLRYGDGAEIADALGDGGAEKAAVWLDTLPPLPGENGAAQVVELARLMTDNDTMKKGTNDNG